MGTPIVPGTYRGKKILPAIEVKDSVYLVKH